ncbi:MAG: hypothetical protein IEMM0008_0942 [bacterium]|nr:MAG: hypothetical protein IEMM0008_0942 [bacterium]
MSFKRISLIIFIVACSKTLWPCSCLYEDPFIDMAKESVLVVRAKVLKYFPYKANGNYLDYKAMDIEIMEIYKGQEVKKTIRVWGDDGALCRPYVVEFTIGKTYIFALAKGGGKFGADYEENDYVISICGEFYLKVKKQIVIGHITNKNLKMKRQRMKLAFFNGFLRGVLSR